MTDKIIPFCSPDRVLERVEQPRPSLQSKLHAQRRRPHKGHPQEDQLEPAPRPTGQPQRNRHQKVPQGPRCEGGAAHDDEPAALCVTQRKKFRHQF